MLPFHLEWKLPFLTPKTAAFLICFASGREFIRWWKSSQAGLWAILNVFHVLISNWCFVARTAKGTVLREAHWTLVTLFVELGVLLWHLGKSLQSSVIFFFFFQGALNSIWNKSPQIGDEYHSFEIYLKKKNNNPELPNNCRTCPNSNVFSKVITRWIGSFVYFSVHLDMIDFVLGRCLVCDVKSPLKDVYIFSVCKVFQSLWWCHKMYFIACSYKSRLFKLLC